MKSISALLRLGSPMFGLFFALTVVASTELEHWRDELTRIRALAENDVPLAYQQALQLQSSTPAGLTPADQARFLNLQARIEVYLALMDKAAEHIRLARNIAVRHDDKIGQIEADLNAAPNLVNQGKIDELIAVTTHSMTLLAGIDNPLLLSEAMLRVGMMYRRIGQFDESVALAMQAMEAAKQSNDPMAMIYAHQGLAIAFDQSGRHQEAKEHYTPMREQAQRAHSKIMEGYALIGMGNIRSAMGDKAGGERLIREGIALHRATQSPFNINFGLFALSVNLRDQKRYREALAILNEVQTVYEKYHNRIGLWYTLNALSTLHQSLAEIKAAQAYAEQGARLAKDIGFSLYISESTKLLARLASEQKDYRRAYQLHLKADEITEKAVREKNAMRMLELAERYQTESKQREIESLKRRNEQQSGELRQKALQQNLLSTVLGGSTLMLLGTALFLLRLRHSHRQLESVNSRLQQSQQQLQHQSGILQSILDSMVDGVSVVDEHGELILINPIGEKILGLSEQDFGRTDNSQKRYFYLPDTMTLFPEEELPLAKAIRGEACEGLEIYLRDPEQAEGCWLSVTAGPLTDKDGKIIGGVEVFSDITERKRAEQSIHELNASLEHRVYERTQELRQQARYLRTLIDMLPMWAWFKNTENRYLVSNQAHACACGHSVEAMVGKVDSDLWPRAIASVNQADDSEVMALRSRKNTEQRFPDKNGGAWMETYKAAVLDEDGAVLGTVGVARDISVQKASEAAREQALTEAKRLAQMRSDFLAQMSHELRTPLNGILGYAQILKQDPVLGQRQLNYTQVIYQSGEHLLTLINDILDYAKIEAGKLELVDTDIQLERFLRVIASIITLKAEQKGLTFELQTAADLPAAVRGDDRRLRQVLLNLLANAVKFTAHGQVILRVSLAADKRLRFEVMDTGIGIGNDQFERIFQPFEQAGDLMKHAGGTGLGLAISRQLVRKLGGNIEVESQLGVGSIFRFELAMATVEANASEMSVNGKIIGYAGSRQRILVVDDVLENRSLIIDMLNLLGFEMFEAVNGKQAIEKVQTVRPDLIVMDIVMPEMNGLDACRRLRKIPGYENIPVIGVSASTSSDNEGESLEAGMNAFISKPIDFSVFLEWVGCLLNLDWHYKEAPITAPAAPKNNGTVITPSLEKLHELHHLALLGSMRDISIWAAELTALDSHYQPFADHLLQLVKGYQSKAVLKLVENYLEKGKPS